MSPDFDFWDREEPAEGDESEEENNDTQSEHDEDLHDVKDLLFRKWSSDGTFVVRSEGDKFIITIGTEDGIYAMIKVPAGVATILATMVKDVMGEHQCDRSR